MGQVDLVLPDGLGGQQQGVVVVRLQQVAQVPLVLPESLCLFLRSGLRGLLQPKAEPVWGVGDDGDGPLPFGDLTAQLLQLRRVAPDLRFRLAQGKQPGVMRGVDFRLFQVAGLHAGAHQVIYMGRYELPEGGLGGYARRSRGICGGGRRGGRRHQCGQLDQPLRVVADK